MRRETVLVSNVCHEGRSVHLADVMILHEDYRQVIEELACGRRADSLLRVTRTASDVKPDLFTRPMLNVDEHIDTI